MSRDLTLYVEDMVEAVRRVSHYSAGMTREAFLADAKTVDAVVRNLEVLGEAAKHVPDEMRTRYPAVEWKKIAGMRDVLAHEYFGIDEDICGTSSRTKFHRSNRCWNRCSPAWEPWDGAEVERQRRLLLPLALHLTLPLPLALTLPLALPLPLPTAPPAARSTR